MLIASESRLNATIGVSNNVAAAWFVRHVADILNKFCRDQGEEMLWRVGRVRQESGVLNTRLKPEED